MVYVTGAARRRRCHPSVTVIARSALALSASLSVAELLPGVGSVNTPAGAATVAVLLSVPVAAAKWRTRCVGDAAAGPAGSPCC